MYQSFGLRLDTLASSHPFQKDEGNPSTIQGGEGEYIDYGQVYAEEGSEFQQGANSGLGSLPG